MVPTKSHPGLFARVRFVFVALVVLFTALSGILAKMISENASADSGTVIIESNKTYGTLSTELTGRDIVVKSGATLTLSGKQRFNSLHIESGATVTHPALELTDIDLQTNELNTTGSEKVLDLEITNDLLVAGRIDVSGKGYPAYPAENITHDCMAKNTCGAGYGPGAGSNVDTHDEATRAAGAGHGGTGANGNINGTVSTKVLGGRAYDFAIRPTLHGSSGGSASRHRHDNHSDGGRGGGVVLIKASALQISGGGSIAANGLSQTGSANGDIWGGGGSGGTINILVDDPNPISSYISSATVSEYTELFNYGVANSEGTVIGATKSSQVTEERRGSGAVNHFYILGGDAVLKAQGGASQYGGLGAGGRIYVGKNDDASLNSSSIGVIKTTYSDSAMTKVESTFEKDQKVYVKILIYQPIDYSGKIVFTDDISNVQNGSVKTAEASLKDRNYDPYSGITSEARLTFEFPSGLKKGYEEITYEYVAN